MTEQTTQITPPMDLSRLHRTALVMSLLAAHPAVAAAPIDWEITDRDELWAKVKYGIPEAGAAVQTLAAALGTDVIVHPVKGRNMYAAYGEWAGVQVSLQAFGPELAEADEVAA